MGVFVHNIYIIRFRTTQIRYISFGACCHLDPSSRVVNINYQSNMSKKKRGTKSISNGFLCFDWRIHRGCGGIDSSAVHRARGCLCPMRPKCVTDCTTEDNKNEIDERFFRLGVRFGSRARSAVVGGVGPGSAHNDIVKGGLQKIYADGKIVHLHR